MSGISGPAVQSCPWCGRSVEQGEGCWCKGARESGEIGALGETSRPAAVTLHCWAPEQAEEEFLARFRELKG